MRAPRFWQRDGLLPRLLSPLGALYAGATARRLARPGWRAPVPVLCCGNAGAGGAGKTTLALEIGARLAARGVAVAFITRGYGGRVPTPRRVAAGDAAALVGDEALLLAAVGPCFVGADRAAAARLAVADGAQALVMDDGLQNPSLVKDFSFLVIDGASGFGNGRVIPAGPLREPAAAAASRCGAAVLIGADDHGAAAALPPELPVLRARLEAAGAEGLAGQRVLAFAGIGRPGKFFATLEAAGVILAERVGFADHHPYAAVEVERIVARAARLGAVAVTTPKDAMRLPPALRARVRVVGVRLVWADPSAIERLLAGLMAGR
jgi:tetraacyldisaccharide 4'-kinase